MKEELLIDTGPIVASLVQGDEHNDWAREQFGRFSPPLLTCEAVLAEACYILESRAADPVAVIRMLKAGVLVVAFNLGEEVNAIEALIRRYRNIPMSLADACMVRMTELLPKCRLLTTDSDFRVYRRLGRAIIPILTPWDTSD